MPKKSSKKPKNTKLLKLLNPATNKGKFFIFILAFVVIGGGFAAYRSFAATTETTVPASYISYTGYSYATTDTTGDSKSSISVIGLGTYDGSHGKALTGTDPALPTGTRAVRSCAWIKRTGTAAFEITGVSSRSDRQPTRHTKKFTNMLTSTNYIKVCTEYVPTDGRDNRIAIIVTHNSGADIRLQSVVLDWY